ncbi:MAG: hypothetical protein JXB29_12420 [Sedimentisphaerales bacterium]|nr:hypothetical protein [Sedimentisphaerales bacterium]
MAKSEKTNRAPISITITSDGKLKFSSKTPEQVKKQAFFPMFPFKQGQETANSVMFSSEWPRVSRRIPLTKDQFEIIKRAVGSYRIARIKSFLTQMCSISDPTALSWDDIIAHLETYLDLQQKKQLQKTASGSKGGGKRKKTPPQLLKETRERQTAKELAKEPNKTAEELGKLLGCHKSTVVRLKAWQKRGVLANPKPPNGFKKQPKDDKSRGDIEAIYENEPNDEGENPQ